MAVIDNNKIKTLAASEAQKAAAVTGSQTTAAAAQQTANTTTKQAAAPALQDTTTPAATPYTGLAGLSSGTQEALGKYAQGYTPSASVTAAQAYLDQVVGNKPGDYRSQYQDQLNGLYDQIMNRKAFSYDLNGDMLYNQYKQQYQQLGKRAMKDTMGNAATLTGGYGNSYAQTAGQQAYQDYLTKLNDIVPDLYDRARDQYNQEGNDLNTKLNLVQGMEDKDYGRYRDTVSDWQNERTYANGEYWNERNFDYSDYQNMLNYYNQLGQQENTQYNTDKQMAYSQAMSILQTGKVPSSALLKKAGISSSDAKKLAAAHAKSSGGGGGSRRRSSGGGGNYNPGTGDSSGDNGTLGNVADALYQNIRGGVSKGLSATAAVDSINNYVKRGKITKNEGALILSKLGMQ